MRLEQTIHEEQRRKKRQIRKRRKRRKKKKRKQRNVSNEVLMKFAISSNRKMQIQTTVRFHHILVRMKRTTEQRKAKEG